MTHRSNSQPLQMMMGWVDLTRIALAPTAVSNIWLVLLWSRTFEPRSGLANRPIGESMLLTAAVAVGLYVFGMVLNDLLDVRRDRLFAKRRPLTSGRITLRSAMVAALCALLVAVLSATMMGAGEAIVCLGCAALIVFYNSAGKHLPALGLISLGLVRVTHMLVANPTFGFTWILWLTFSQVLLISAVGYVLERKRPRLYPTEVWALVLGWVCFTTAMVVWMVWLNENEPPGGRWLWIGPMAAGVAFAVVAVRSVRGAADQRSGGKALVRQGLMWLIVFDAAWLASAGLYREAVIIGSLYVLTWALVAWVRTVKRAEARRAASPAQVQPSR